MDLDYTSVVTRVVEEKCSAEDAVSIFVNILENKITISDGVVVGNYIWAIDYYSNLLLCINTANRSAEIADAFYKTWNYKEEGFKKIIIYEDFLYLIPGKEKYVVEFDTKNRKSEIYQLDKYSDYMSAFVYENYLYMIARGDGLSYKINLIKHQIEIDPVVNGTGFLGGTLVDDYYICGLYPDNRLVRYDLKGGKIEIIEIGETDTYYVDCSYDGEKIYCLTQNGEIHAFNKGLDYHTKIAVNDYIVEKKKWFYQGMSVLEDYILLIPNRKAEWKIVYKKDYRIETINSFNDLYPQGETIFPCRSVIDGTQNIYIPVIDGTYPIYTVNKCEVTFAKGWDVHYKGIDKQCIKEALNKMINYVGIMNRDDLNLLIKIMKYKK